MIELLVAIGAIALCISAGCQVRTLLIQLKFLGEHKNDAAIQSEQEARNKRHDAVHDSWQAAYDRMSANYQKALDAFGAKVDVALAQHAEAHRLPPLPQIEPSEPKKS